MNAKTALDIWFLLKGIQPDTFQKQSAEPEIGTAHLEYRFEKIQFENPFEEKYPDLPIDSRKELPIKELPEREEFDLAAFHDLLKGMEIKNKNTPPVELPKFSLELAFEKMAAEAFADALSPAAQQALLEHLLEKKKSE